MKPAAAVSIMLTVIIALFLPVSSSLAATPVQGTSIPRETSEVRNPRFKNELDAIAPNYDSMSRDEQVRAYIKTYRSLNYGAFPYIVSEDLQDAGAGSTLASLPVLIPVAPSRSYGSPPESGFIQHYVEGYGYKRIPDRGASAARRTRAEPHYAGDSGRSLRIGVPGSTNVGAPPYAKPYVAQPHKAPTIHAGP